MTDHHGGCQCGKVRFVASGPLREVVFCHCSQCRRQTGLYIAATAVDIANLDITGVGALTWYASSPHADRAFCGTCGSPLFWRPASRAYISILAGSFDDSSVLTPGYHICTDGRATFYAITDGLPQHPHSAPGLATAPQG
ncbi:MAG: GFA family protein [Gemmobacter sp.]